MLALLLACANEPAGDTAMPVEAPLVRVDAWEEAAVDPFADEPSAAEGCDPYGWLIEDGTLEVQTDRCAHATVAQPLGARLAAGDGVTVALYHDALWAPEPTTSHVAVGIGDRVLVSWTFDVPGPPGVYEETAALPSAVDAGEPVWFHVRNHGTNTYRLVAIEREDP